MPKISVIIPTYNHEQFVKQSINSVINQTFKDLEILIIDDCSPDKTAERVKEISDPRIHFIQNETNQGPGYSVNLCLEKSQGEYIALLNSDDFWEPTKLEKQLMVFESNQSLGIVFTDVRFITESGDEVQDNKGFYTKEIFNQKNRSKHEWLNYFYHSGNCLCHPSILAKRQVYQEVGLYKNTLRQLPDFEMWVRTVKKFQFPVIDEKLVNFRLLGSELNASSSSVPNIMRSKAEFYVLFKDFFHGLSIQDFKLTFPDFAKDKSIVTAEDFYCAKAVFFLEQPSAYTSASLMVAYEMLYDGLNDPKIRKILNQVYKIDEKVLYQIPQRIEFFEEINNRKEAILFNRLPEMVPYDRLKLSELILYTINKTIRKVLKKILFRKH